MIFIYGRTPYPKQTFDIYLPLAREVLPVVGCENRERLSRFIWSDRYMSGGSWRRGHRKGTKGTTLRTHRIGR